MNVKMLPVEIIGLKRDLPAVLHALREAGCLHIEALSDSPRVSARPLALDRDTLARQEELNVLLARVEGLLAALEIGPGQGRSCTEGDHVVQAHVRVESLAYQVQSLLSRREELREKQSLLPRYEATLRKLLPLLPDSVHQPGNVSTGLLVSRSHVGVLDAIARGTLELTGGRAEIAASDIDSSTRAMFLVFPQEFAANIENLLGQKDVSRLRLPAELGEVPPDAALQALQRRLTAIPVEIREINLQMAGLAQEWQEHLWEWCTALREELDTLAVLSRFGETDTTFVIAGWTPEEACERLEAALHTSIGDTILVRKLPMIAELKKLAPVALQNPTPTRPFESLVRLLTLPRYDHIDPTCMMAFFMPFFFGMILGDVGYGALLLVISLILHSRQLPGTTRDILTILAMGSAWAILFGFLYGELFGTLGEHLGLHALWFDRASPEHVGGLLAMALVVGAVHITLGLILGVWESIRERSRNEFLERGGMLLGLICLFSIIGVLTSVLPDGLMTPAIAGMVTGIVLIGASLGKLGILMGPIEFIGLIGNVLSYLRIAAIGLASVYLAKVANDLAGIVGNIIVGAILAVLIHALNLVMGAFSPTIHSLRLHYVEFFRKFYTGGGKPYQPYRSHVLEPRGRGP